MVRFILISWLLIFFLQVDAQKNEPKWVVDSFNLPSTQVQFTVSEGTWLNLDVSPNGKQIVFDLLGDIYLMPISGGKADQITSGMAFDVQPRFSPDGKKISFTSDRGGADNIWVMNLDGTDPKQISTEDFRLLNNAIWTPDGQYIIARKHFTSTRSLGAGEMWLFDLDGGKGVQLTKKRTEQKDAGEPCISPDGRFLYWSEDLSPGNYFEYNKDPNGQIYGIRRVDLITGEIENIAGGSGGAVRPQISPDGKSLAFVKRIRDKSVLHVLDLETFKSRAVWDGLTKDQQETWAIFGVYPNFNWLPDNKHLVIWAEGQFWKLNTEDGNAVKIPFSCDVDQKVIKAINFRQSAFSPMLDVKMIRQLKTSPDGKYLIFNALGYLWSKKMPNGAPQRLSKLTPYEYQPSFSNDGRYLLAVSWDDQKLGSILRFDLNTGKYAVITSANGFYSSPVFSPDGQKILYVKSGGNILVGNRGSLDQGIYMCNNDGSNSHRILESGDQPVFSVDGKHIYYFEDRGKDKGLMQCDLNGKDSRELITSTYATDIAISPDQQWIAFRELFQVYITSFPKTGLSLSLSANNLSLPVKKISTVSGDNIHWSGDSKKLHWTLGNRYYTAEVEHFLEKDYPFDTTGVPIGLKVKSDVPNAKILFTHARVITMNSTNEVLENAFVVVENNKIKLVSTTLPAGFRIAEYNEVDLKGKTILPGLVDVHAHLGYSGNGMSPQQSWPYLANMAFGVTTTHDPSAPSDVVFSQSEMVKAGIIKGPRIFSTGTILYGAEGDFKATINTIDDARNHLKRMKAYGAFSVKSYNQPRRNQRQMVIQAASELGMHVYPEGGSTFYHNLTQIIDGHTGIEHSIPITPVYEDVINLWGKSGCGYTPTLIVGYGGAWGEEYWYDKTNVWENEKLLHWTPRVIVDQRSRRRTKYPDDEFGHFRNAKSCTDIMRGGTKVQLGAHGQLQGLGAHWELWMLVQGGFTNMEALKAATQWGADYIGMGDQIGSIEEGKLADLIVIDGNPLEDIYLSQNLVFTMINGRLYEAETLTEVFTGTYKPTPFWFETENALNWNLNGSSGLTGGCSCHHNHP